MKPIALQLYSVREQAAKDFPGTLRKVAAMGYAGVEFAGLHGMAAGDVARLMAELGLKAAGAHSPMPAKDNIGQLAAEARALGYKRIITGFGPQDMKTKKGVLACADKFRAACAVAAPLGLSVCMHNHWWEFSQKFNRQTAYEMIMQAVPELMSELDVYWSTKGGAKTPAVVKKWAARIPLLHIKDGDLGDDHVMTAVGQGKVDMRPIIAAADENALEWLVVELDACKTDMLEAVAASCRFLVDNQLGYGRR